VPILRCQMVDLVFSLKMKTIFHFVVNKFLLAELTGACLKIPSDF